MSDVLADHQICGEGEVTVFLLHGAYGDGRYFSHTRDVLVAAGYRVVVWDCPGYGRSPIPDDSGIEAHATAAAELVTAVGGTRNVLLGHSMGGLIAPRAALLVPERVVGVVLSCTSAGIVTRSAEEQKRFFAERVDPITDGQSVGEYAPGLLKTMMGPGAAGPLVDTVVSVVCEMRTETFKASMRAIATYDGTEALRQLRVPVLLIAGELDPACPPDGLRYMSTLIADNELHEIAGVGHYGFAERPDEYHPLLLSFLANRITTSRISTSQGVSHV
jgi:pimeloyl-ACP methyl ester carboxylesterase